MFIQLYILQCIRTILFENRCHYYSATVQHAKDNKDNNQQQVNVIHEQINIVVTSLFFSLLGQ